MPVPPPIKELSLKKVRRFHMRNAGRVEHGESYQSGNGRYKLDHGYTFNVLQINNNEKNKDAYRAYIGLTAGIRK